MKNILVIGGSYFAGRVFNIVARDREDVRVSVLNRGTYALNMEGVIEYKTDRKDKAAIASLLPQNETYDAVIDFCAYFPGEIADVLEAVPGKIKQYIYISTCSVYEHAEEKLLEGAKRVSKAPEGPVEEYAFNKMLLEDELKRECAKRDIAWTIMRPTFIYGPFNYAPREAFFFNAIFRGESLPVPRDATGAWSFVYVKDMAELLLLAAGNEKAYGKEYNLAAPEDVTYESLTAVLGEIHGDFPTHGVSIERVYKDEIPLPFPIDSSELYDGALAASELGFTYTPLKDGMAKSYDVHRDVFFPDYGKCGCCD